jgi:hypothetical protein
MYPARRRRVHGSTKLPIRNPPATTGGTYEHCPVVWDRQVVPYRPEGVILSLPPRRRGPPAGAPAPPAGRVARPRVPGDRT